MRFPLAAALALACLLAALLPAAADARRGPCMVGTEQPRCHVWTGKLAWVDDGDTLHVDVHGDGTRKPLHVRMIGIQAMEQTRYARNSRAGDCHAVEATERLEALIRRGKKRVRLAAQDPESRTRGRYFRSVAVKLRGRWRDLGAIMVGEGRALWLANRAGYAFNQRYSVLTQRAERLGRGLFAAEACAPGPNPGHSVRVWVNADADGADRLYPEGEWVRVKNLDPESPLPLDGWHVRDTGLRRYTFPAGTLLPPGGTLTVRVGRGEPADADEHYWGLRKAVFDNPTFDRRALGDGAYLFDPHGDLRASMMYPCRVECHDPLQGALAISAKPRGRERVDVTNTSGGPVDLEGYRLATPPFAYHFAAGTVLQPGETLRLRMGGDPDDDTPLRRHWGMMEPILRNRGDVVRVTTYTWIELACDAWGDRSC
ncbi:MAG TPA: lamin tail domain-containing protein [Solirubrobacteraceae bacterium]|nr:lamin tail domain-containing protein [Solirubrobacteraceae bacterium]